MRTLCFLFFLGCASIENPDVSSSLPSQNATQPAQPQTTTAPAPVIASLPTSSPSKLALPATKVAPKRYSYGRALLDCNKHTAWSEPTDWIATEFKGGVLAYSPDQSAAIFRGSTKDQTGKEAQHIAEEIAAVPLRFAAPVRAEKHKWSWKVTTTGEGTLGGSPVLVTLIQEDPRSQRDGLWVLVSSGKDAKTNHTLMEGVVAKMLMLTDHACACGYDCYTKAAKPNVTR